MKFAIKTIDVMIEGTRRQQPIVVYMPRMRSLSYLNEWLGQATSFGTARQYAKILQRFCNYLAEYVYNGKEKESLILEFWLFSDSQTLTAWKTHRLMMRNRSRKPDGSRVSSPSEGTVNHEADVVCTFLDWVKHDMHVSTLWNGSRKTIKSAASIQQQWMAGIASTGTREVVNVNTNVFFGDDENNEGPLPVAALAKRSQRDTYQYLYDDQIALLVAAFPDPVYAFIALTGYLTGLRPHEALAVPWYLMDEQTGTVFSGAPGYLQDCIRKYPPDKRDAVQISLQVLGKGKKLRTVKFPAMGWLALMKMWAPLRKKRNELYEKREGKECPDWVLWLNKKGEPLYCPPGRDSEHLKPLSRLQEAFYRISVRRKNGLKKKFNQPVSYYTMRHTFATNFTIKTMEARNNYNEGDYLVDLRLQQDLADQMGHDAFDTTLKYYIIHSIAITNSSNRGERVREVFTVDNLFKHLDKRQLRS